MMSKNIVVVGGGAAGMMAAIAAADQGHQVTILEKNEKLGKIVIIFGYHQHISCVQFIFTPKNLCTYSIII